MLQEDSNGDTFEIIDRKPEELPTPEKTDLSGGGGNLLSTVPPPMALPSFLPAISSPSVPPPAPPVSRPKAANQPPVQQNFPAPIQTPIPSQPINTNTMINIQPIAEPFYPTQFSAAIPPNKGLIMGGPAGNQDSGPAQQAEPGGGLLGWVRGAVSGGGLISKVVEKTKSSVDSMITTLDPQMREYIYSGGDVYVLVASEQEAKVGAIREAFQSVFGRATVVGHPVQVASVAAQPVGFAAGVKAAEERIQTILNDPNLREPTPVVAVENFLLEVGEDRWYDLGVVALSDPARQVALQTFTQMTPVPAAVVALAQEDTPPDYPLRWSGLAVPIGSLMAKNLNVPRSEWHLALTGVSRRELLLMAARTLAGMYKSALGDALN